jgi:hypothetical protein
MTITATTGVWPPINSLDFDGDGMTFVDYKEAPTSSGGE